MKSDEEGAGADVSAADVLRVIERERLRALVNADIEVASRLHAGDVPLITPSGASLSKDEYLGGITTGAINYRVWEPGGPIDVRLFGPVGLIRYRARLEIVINGQSNPVRQYWHTDSYEKREGQWQVVWSQATEIAATQ